MVKDTSLFATKERDQSPCILGLETPQAVLPERD
jgi:hypothetical protein